MILFGEKVKPSNVSKITVILGLAIFWRILLGEIEFEGPKDPYIFPVIAFSFISILLGELTRRIVRIFLKDKIVSDKLNELEKFESIEMKKDDDTLNASIMWEVIFIILTLL